MVALAPTPRVGQSGKVVLNSVPLEVIDGTYAVGEAPSYAEKLTIGETKYADLTFAVSAHAVASLAGGYGVRRYSDLAPEDKFGQQSYLESVNVDARHDPTILGPLQTALTVTGIVATPVWGGEFVDSGGTRRFVLIAGTKLWHSTDLSTWTDSGLTLGATPLQGAVGVYGGKLLIGYGASATAQWTRNLTSLNNVTDNAGVPVNIHVFAFTADKAAAYIAGGTATTDSYKVMSSEDQSTTTFAFETASIVVCGKLDTKITALAPGGGIHIVMVGKEDELGAINTAGDYTVLVPFDVYNADSNRGMRWWLSAGGEEQRGPMILMFPRERALWAYQPATDMSGQAQNISPWIGQGRRPLTIRGRITAIQGSARWLYFAVQASSNNTWIVARDARTGASHPILDVGGNDCRMLAITTLGVSNPRLLIGKGNGLASVILPLDGDAPIDDTACRYAATGSLYIPDIDLNLPDEDKIAYSIRVIADDIVADHQEIDVYVAYDDGAYALLGTIDESPSKELEIVPPRSNKRISIRLDFFTDDSTLTPKFLGLVYRASVNPKLFRTWEFQARFPGTGHPYDDISNPYAEVSDFWSLRARGTPVTFMDRWNDTYTVKIRQMREQDVYSEENRTLETILTMQLLATAAVPFTEEEAPVGPVWQLDVSELGTGTILA